MDEWKWMDEWFSFSHAAIQSFKVTIWFRLCRFKDM